MNPKIGQWVEVRGVMCVITAVLPCGTIEVLSLDGKHAWRLSGLPIAGEA